MKKSLFLSLLLIASVQVLLAISHEPRNIISQTQYDLIGSLYYDISGTTKTASVLPSKKKNASNQTVPYAMESIAIPSIITVEAECVGENCQSATITDTIKITTISAKAFSKAKASSVVFAEPSNVATIGTLAFSNMANMSGKLTLPASLTALAVSSILLPNITEIEFLGSVPPTCEISGGYNPWTYSSGSTPDSIKITVPEGAKEAYQKAAGIGDYFTCLKGTTTALGETEATPATSDKDANNAATTRKLLRNGILYIERNGSTYDAFGKSIR